MDYTGLKLSMHVLIDELKSYNLKSDLNHPFELRPTQLRKLNIESGKPLEGFLYVTDYLTVKSLGNSKTSLNFICPDGANHDINQIANINIICLDSSLTTDALFNILLEIFEKYSLWHQRLLQIIIKNGSYNELLTIGAEMLLNPIAFFNPSLELITYAGRLPEHYDGTIWEQVIDLGYTPLEYYSDDDKKKLFNDLSKKEYPYLYKQNESDKYTQLNATLCIKKKRVGSFGSIDINKPFTSGQIFLVNHLKLLVEAYIINRDDSLFLSTDLDSLINKMIKGYYVEEKVVQYHLKKSGWKSDASFHLLVFENLIQDFSDHSLYKTYKYRIERFFKNCITTPLDGYMIAVVIGDIYSIKTTEHLDDFNKFLEGISLKCGVSLGFSEFLDLKYYFRQAVSALRSGKNQPEEILSNRHCFFYQDFFLEDLVQSLEKRSNLRSFCHPQIVSLNKYDVNSGSEYVKTLYHYLLCGRNLTDAAEKLFIHRNTLNYRITRIREMIDIDIDDYNQSFYLLTSCRLVTFL